MYFPIRTLYLTWKIEQRERRKFKHHCLEMDQMLVWIAFTEFAKSFNQSEQRYSFSANQVQNRNQSWLGFGFFLALSAGCIFSHALRWLQPGCIFFFALRWLQVGCIFSRAYRWLHVSPRFPPALCFPVLSTCCLLLSLVPFLPVLTSGCMFSIGVFIRFFFFISLMCRRVLLGKKWLMSFVLQTKWRLLQPSLQVSGLLQEATTPPLQNHKTRLQLLLKPIQLVQKLLKPAQHPRQQQAELQVQYKSVLQRMVC